MNKKYLSRRKSFLYLYLDKVFGALQDHTFSADANLVEFKILVGID